MPSESTLRTALPLQVESQIQILELFKDLSSLLESPLNSKMRWRALLGILKRFIPYESATLFIADSETTQLKVREQVGPAQVELISPIRFDMGFGLSAWIAKRRTPIVIPRLRRFQTGPGGVHSYIGLPLSTSDHLLGVLNFGHPEAGTFESVDEKFLTLLMGQLSLLMHNLELMSNLKRRNKELQARHLELQDLQSQLVKQERLQAIADTVATLNHEINNPLTIISGAAELLSLSLADKDEKVHTKLQTILSQTRRLGRFLGELAHLRQTKRDPYPGGGHLLHLPSADDPDRCEKA
jgi:transcriptional regulator with GAF, ATPase, and Fis domain